VIANEVAANNLGRSGVKISRHPNLCRIYAVLPTPDRTVETEHMMVAMLGARLMVCSFGQAVAHSSDKGSPFPFAYGAPKAANRLEILRWHFCTFLPLPAH
jgi:hypothetical protein